MRGKTFIFIKTCNKTFALKFWCEKLTDEIMDQIETKTGAAKKQQRITHNNKQLTTRQTFNHCNIQENNTIDPSLDLEGGTETADPTEQPATDMEESAAHNDAETIERKPSKRRASEAGVDVPKSADVDTAVKQLKSDLERLAKQNHEAVMLLAKQHHDNIAATLGATLSTMRQESNARFARVDAKIEGNTNALEAMKTRIDARINAHENILRKPQRKRAKFSSCRSHRFHRIVHGRRSERIQTRSKPKEHAFEESLQETHCPAKPITHAFMQFKTEEDRN